MVEGSKPGRIVVYYSEGEIMVYKDVTEISTATSTLYSADDWRITSAWEIDSIMSNKLKPVSSYLGKKVNLTFVADGKTYELGEVISRQDEVPGRAIYIGRASGFPVISPVSGVHIKGEKLKLINKKDASRPVFIVQGKKLNTNMRCLHVENVVLPTNISGIITADNPEIKTWILMT
ncbi:MAG: hypothetical protein OEX81_03505 [Candidatus Pacebacteria bacterium]|nr:hypothetical protein [Candidatus Paceibacterota bacterium]